MPGPSSDDDRFYQARATRALLAAMSELAQRSGCLLSELEGLPMAEVYRLAETTYGPELPEFWQIWKEWQEPPDLSTLGEL